MTGRVKRSEAQVVGIGKMAVRLGAETREVTAPLDEKLLIDEGPQRVFPDLDSGVVAFADFENGALGAHRLRALIGPRFIEQIEPANRRIVRVGVDFPGEGPAAGAQVDVDVVPIACGSELRLQIVLRRSDVGNFDQVGRFALGEYDIRSLAQDLAAAGVAIDVYHGQQVHGLRLGRNGIRKFPPQRLQRILDTVEDGVFDVAEAVVQPLKQMTFYPGQSWCHVANYDRLPIKSVYAFSPEKSTSSNASSPGSAFVECVTRTEVGRAPL
jgi:hypothetical protein